MSPRVKDYRGIDYIIRKRESLYWLSSPFGGSRSESLSEAEAVVFRKIDKRLNSLKTVSDLTECLNKTMVVRYDDAFIKEKTVKALLNAYNGHSKTL